MTTIRSVARASRILVQLGEQPDGRTAKEVAVALGLPLPTTYHLLGTLVAEGFVAKDSRRRYRLGPALGTIADAYVRQFSPPEYLIGPLHRLADETGETVYVVTWRHDRIVVLASVEGGSAVRVSGANLGYVESAHARASGKLLLAFASEEVRAAYLALNPLVPVTPRTIVQPDEFELELERIRLARLRRRRGGVPRGSLVRRGAGDRERQCRLRVLRLGALGAVRPAAGGVDRVRPGRDTASGGGRRPRSANPRPPRHRFHHLESRPIS